MKSMNMLASTNDRGFAEQNAHALRVEYRTLLEVTESIASSWPTVARFFSEAVSANESNTPLQLNCNSLLVSLRTTQKSHRRTCALPRSAVRPRAGVNELSMMTPIVTLVVWKNRS